MATAAQESTTIPSRMMTLDIFRGLTMMFMVLVSNPGSLDIYKQLDHALGTGRLRRTLSSHLFSGLWVSP
jgi:predicted acyltransferase